MGTSGKSTNAQKRALGLLCALIACFSFACALSPVPHALADDAGAALATALVFAQDVPAGDGSSDEAAGTSGDEGDAEGSGETEEGEDPNPLKGATVKLAHEGVFPYTGYAWKPAFTVKLGDKDLVEGVDYEAPEGGYYKYNDIENGDALIAVKGVGAYEGGTAEVKFAIKKMDLKTYATSTNSPFIVRSPGTSGDKVADQVFKGEGVAIEPAVEFAYEETSGSGSSASTTYLVVSPEAYSVSFSDNAKIGYAKVSVTADLPGYMKDAIAADKAAAEAGGTSAKELVWEGTFTKEKAFRIGYDISTVKVKLLDAEGKEMTGGEFVYTGDAIKPDKVVVVAAGSIESEEGTDTSSAEGDQGEGASDTPAEEAGASAGLSGGEGGSQATGEDEEQGGADSTQEGDGQGQADPDATDADDAALKEGEDYTVLYYRGTQEEKDCKQAGEISVVVSGAGSYVGSTDPCAYKIAQKDISEDDVTVTGLDALSYTGAALEPALTVKYGKNTLSEPYTYYYWSNAGDYTVEYTDNTNPGQAIVVLKAVEDGNYKGTRTEHFAINDVPKAPKLVAQDRGYGRVALSWNNIFDSSASGKVTAYQVRWKDAKGKWLTKFKSTTNSTMASNLACKRSHSFQVRAYADGAWQAWSNTASVKPTGIKKPTNLHAVSSGKKSIRLSWDSVPGASKYEILEKEGTGKFVSRTNSFTSNIANIPGLKKKGKYTYAVRAYVEGKWAKCAKKAYVKVSPADAAPATITAKTTGSGKVKLSWKKVRGAKKYWVQYKGSDGKWKTCTKKLKKRTYTVKNLKTGYYTFRVRAYGNKKWSPKYDEYNTYLLVYAS